VDVVDDPWPAVWRKVVTNAAVNPTTALLGCVNADLLADRAAGRIADGLAREVARVATAHGVAIAEDDAVRWWRDMAQLTGANRSSMLQDVEAKRPTEVDAIGGAVERDDDELDRQRDEQPHRRRARDERPEQHCRPAEAIGQHARRRRREQARELRHAVEGRRDRGRDAARVDEVEREERERARDENLAHDRD